MAADYFDLTPSPRLLEVLGDIPLAPWQCVAELVDNAFDDFLSASPGDQVVPEVEVTLPTGRNDSSLVVTDKGRGMKAKDFEASLRAGYSGRGRFGTLGLFGMGFNIATARLGTRTTVRTARRGSGSWTTVTIDFRELQEQESFRVPVQYEEKLDPEESGTQIVVEIRKELTDELRRASSLKALREKLGEVYSYLLRDSVPGLSSSEASGPSGFRLLVNGKLVAPKLPCIWNEDRAVTSHGQEVHAVQYVDVPLSDAWACQICGQWDRAPEPDRCAECGSKALERRQRRIHGWLGVQRYIDTNRYGIDFLRQGRKILIQDKSLFTYEDPDTGATDIEYPIEMPANRGRLVGEIHLDHVRVTYQKNDFDRSSQDWYQAVEQIRGHVPMKPRKKGSANQTPLGLLYSAFRRNDPGLRYLTPGDGSKALNDKAKQWAEQFYAGVASYQPDTLWYEAAELHQRIKDGDVVGEGEHPNSPVDDILGTDGGQDSGSESDAPTSVPDAPESDQERFARYQANGVIRQDLSGPVALPGGSAWDLTVWATRESLKADGTRVPTVARLPKGTQLEVYVDVLHPVFVECGRDIRDFAILEAAQVLGAESKQDGPKGSAAYLAAELTQLMPDQKFTEPLMRERVETVVTRIKERSGPVIAEDPSEFWNSLRAPDKEQAESNAAAAGVLNWDELTKTGEFVDHLGAHGLAQLVRLHPAQFLDGGVFRPAWRLWKTEDAKVRSVEKIARGLDILGDFLEDNALKSASDLTVVRVLAEQLQDQLRSEEE